MIRPGKFITLILFLSLFGNCDSVKRDRLPAASELLISCADSKDFESGIGFMTADQSQLIFEKEVLSGDGSANQPFKYKLAIYNPTDENWKGIVKIDLVSPSSDADFFLPGFCTGITGGMWRWIQGLTNNTPG